MALSDLTRKEDDGDENYDIVLNQKHYRDVSIRLSTKPADETDNPGLGLIVTLPKTNGQNDLAQFVQKFAMSKNASEFF